MILSWQIAKRRIAAGTRPGFLAAWGLVVVDWAIILAVLAMLWNPFMRIMDAGQFGDGVMFLLLFVLFFIPMQAVLIASSMWAVRSRWEDVERNQN